jgi:5-(carboxyamino)imidazole ribonucleotide synthase
MTKIKVGVIGGGQLAWMMAQSAKILDIDLFVQTPSLNDPAVSLATDVVLAQVDDSKATEKLAEICDVITFENEFVNLQALQKVANQGVCFRPSLASLSPLLDKYHQRCFLKDLGLSVPKFEDYNPKSTNINQFSFPFVLKARRHGYDGQGTVIIHNQNELNSNLQNFGNTPLLVEEFIPFEQELAIIASRSINGKIVVYPVVETYQKNQVCHWVIIPANLTYSQTQQINDIASKLLTKLNYVGVLGIELFLTSSGEILVNEIAPRTHNSGHYTLDGCVTSQFAMQLQAITGQPLGDVSLKFPGCVMVNLLGFEHSHNNYQEKRAKISSLENTHLHWYNKIESRPGRKLGHVTVLFDVKSGENTHQKAEKIAKNIESIWYNE